MFECNESWFKCIAFLYKPGLSATQCKDAEQESNNYYLFDKPPASLPQCLSSFCFGGMKTNDTGPEICSCDGFSGSGGCLHMHLKFEGSQTTCSNCQKSYCKTCAFISSIDKEKKKSEDEKVYYKNCNEI